jgi:universal stress protein E
MELANGKTKEKVMQGIKRVLAIVDTRKDKHIAVNRAVQIAKTTGASLHLLAPNPKADTESAEKLNSLTRKIQAEGVETTSQELWRHDVIETIIHIRQMERSHIVVKDYQLKSFLGSPFSTPVDWALLRQSRVPVLLVRHDRPWENENILAAINADPEDTDHQLLNLAIMENARSAATIFGAPLHIASAYPTVMLAMQDKGDGLTDKDRFEANCEHFAKDYKVPREAVHVVPAPAETAIPDLTRELRASLLVMGTNARTGLTAFTLGNTAEELARHIDCDLLAVQSKHHMLPLERELEQ